MKKIMFNDKYGLTADVLEESKTMTRRVVKGLQKGVIDVRICEGVCECLYEGASRWLISSVQPKFKVGEIVAVAQAYKHIVDNHHFQEQCLANETDAVLTRFDTGWDNKMFVKSYYMPHRIRITDIKAERLQDISDEDCLKEGIYEDAEEHGGLYTTQFYDFKGNKDDGFHTPREAFAALIDKVSGKGTWGSNPWVFAYSFELID